MKIKKFFKPKTNQDIADEVRRLRKKRIGEEGRAKLLTARDEERRRISRARQKTSVTGKIMKTMGSISIQESSNMVTPTKKKRSSSKKKHKKKRGSSTDLWGGGFF